MESDVITLQDVFVAKPPDEDDAQRARQARQPAQPARVHRPEAAVPREDGRERRHPAADVLRGQHGLPAELRSGELRRVRVSRRASRAPRRRRLRRSRRPGRGRRLAEPARRRHERLPDRARHRRRSGRQDGGPADADRERQPGRRPPRREPRRREERRDRDRPLALDGRREARGRPRRRPRVPAHEGRRPTSVAVVGVRLEGGAADAVHGSRPPRRTTLCARSRSTPSNGTALYDALQLSSYARCAAQLGRARVVVLLTDGKDVSSQTSLNDALATAHDSRHARLPDRDRRRQRDRPRRSSRWRARRAAASSRPPSSATPERRSTRRSRASSSAPGASSTSPPPGRASSSTCGSSLEPGRRGLDRRRAFPATPVRGRRPAAALPRAALLAARRAAADACSSPSSCSPRAGSCSPRPRARG